MSFITESERGTKAVVVAVLLVIVLSLSTWFVIFGLDVYGGGWQAQSHFHKVKVSGVEFGTETWDVANPPEDYANWGLDNIKFDPDYEVFNLPDIMVAVGSPRHYTMDIDGEETYVPLDTYSVEFDTDNDGIIDKIIVWNQHRYYFEVTVSTSADYVDETAHWGWGEKASITVWFTFELSNWQFGPASVSDDEDIAYFRQSGWGGVMSNQIKTTTGHYLESDGDATDQEPSDYAAIGVTATDGVIAGYPAPGTPMNMWELETGTSYFGADDHAVEGIPEAVFMSMPVELLPGAVVPLIGSPTIWNVELLVTMQMDILTSENYYPIGGGQEEITTREEERGGANLLDPILAPFIALFDFMAQNPMIVVVIIIAVIALIIILAVAYMKTMSGGLL